MSISAAINGCQPLKNTLEAMRADNQVFSTFILDLFDDFESLHQKLLQSEGRLQEEQQQFADERRRWAEEHQSQAANDAQADAALEAKLADLELDRRALEEELESVRARAVCMAETIANQKNQLDEEQTHWSAELRQLRRMLDKQSTWVAEGTEFAAATPRAPRTKAPLPASANFVLPAIASMRVGQKSLGPPAGEASPNPSTPRPRKSARPPVAAQHPMAAENGDDQSDSNSASESPDFETAQGN